MLRLDSPVSELKGVGESVLTKLQKLNLNVIADLLFHLPFRYEDKTRVIPIQQLVMGMRALVVGTILSVQFKGGPKKITNLVIEDDSGILELRFFYVYPSTLKQLQTGTTLRCFGEVTNGKKAYLMQHPEYEIVKEMVSHNVDAEKNLTPIYPITDGLHQKALSKIIKQSLVPPILKGLDDLNEIAHLNLMPMSEALSLIHNPPVNLPFQGFNRHHPAMVRLILEELVAHHLALKDMKRADDKFAPILGYNDEQKGHSTVEQNTQLASRLLSTLPFQLTSAQNRVIGEIQKDMSSTKPMMRLVQGDVGSGKTIVAALSALYAIQHGYQAVLMAPTELLAEQHLLSFSRWFEPLGLKVQLLSGKLKGKKREQLLLDLKDNKISMLVGTHALFQAGVEFHSLALVIIDEQHRFGVEQRLALWQKGQNDSFVPHQLIMTATPIPRTLAQTAFSDLDISTIDELPPGRKAIKTVAIDQNRRPEVIERIRQNCLKGQQAYWVCPLIEDSETLSAEAAEKMIVQLQAALPELKIGLVHGRLKAADKQSAMNAFKAHETDLLVATTVIEVGVDVPNASLMVIENPERLGLSQLHQLRGRVGRGNQDSFCVLLFKGPLSFTAKSRINVMRQTNDGFIIAEKDLKLRGAGDLLGTRQTGLIEFKIADFEKDLSMFEQARKMSDLIINSYPHLKDILVKRWRKSAKDYIGV